MRRNVGAYLSDIVAACDAIQAVLGDVDLAAYQRERAIRSAVEREFMIIGEAVNALSRLDREFAAGISHSRLIVGFRNQLAHAYATIDDEAVFAIAEHDVPVLRAECTTLLDSMDEAD